VAHFLYDLDTHRTIGVARAGFEPDQLLASTEDPVSIRLQFEALMAGHRLKAFPIPEAAYPEALKLFHQGKELVLEMHRWDPKEMDRARASREEVRKERERRRKRGITEATKADVLDRARRGQTQTQIAKTLEISTWSAARIIKASEAENGASDAA